MASNIGELFIEMGVFADTKELEQFEKKLEKVKNTMDKATKKNDKLTSSVKSFVKGVAGIAGAIGGAIFALNKLTDSLVASNQEFLNLTRNSNVALSTFQKWDSIGRMYGVKNAAQQIANLDQKLFQLKLTGEGAEGFMLAGINPLGQNAEGIMEQLRNRVANLDDTSATFLLTQMGIDPSMLHLLRLGRKEFEELGKAVEKYRLTEKQRGDIQAMNAQLELARIKLQYLKDRAILAIMPYFVEFIKSLTRVAEFLAKIGKHVGSFIVKWRGFVGVLAIGLVKIGVLIKYFRHISTGATKILIKIARLSNFFKAFGAAIGDIITKLPIFGRFLGTLGKYAAKALLPFTALYLLLDDLAVFFQGGDSLIGRVLKWGQEKGGQIADAFKQIFGGDVFGGLDSIKTILEDTLKDVVSLIKNIVGILTGKAIKVTFFKTLDWWQAMFEQKPRTQEEFDQLYRDYAPDWAKTIYTPRVPNQTTNNLDNRQVTMHNVINTSQAGRVVLDELAYVQNTAYSFL